MSQGVEVPDDMQGRSLRPVLEGRTPEDWRKSVYYHYYEFPGPHSVAKHYGVRTSRYKLIRYYDLDEWELFDLVEDPLELKSVYDDDRYRDVRQILLEELTNLRLKYNDDGSVVNFNAQRARDVELKQVVQFRCRAGGAHDRQSVAASRIERANRTPATSHWW